ncbi:unnamed protein product [Urochloa humidicola]
MAGVAAARGESMLAALRAGCCRWHQPAHPPCLPHPHGAGRRRPAAVTRRIRSPASASELATKWIWALPWRAARGLHREISPLSPTLTTHPGGSDARGGATAAARQAEAKAARWSPHAGTSLTTSNPARHGTSPGARDKQRHRIRATALEGVQPCR